MRLTTGHTVTEYGDQVRAESWGNTNLPGLWSLEKERDDRVLSHSLGCRIFFVVVAALVICASEQLEGDWLQRSGLWSVVAGILLICWIVSYCRLTLRWSALFFL